MVSEASIPCDMFVDISGQDCNQPASRLTEALEVLDPGKVLMAVSQKNALKSDVPAFCEQAGLSLEEQGEVDGQYFFLIRKA